MTQEFSPRTGDVLVLVGTRKGAFLLTSDDSRTHWSLSGPHCEGGDVFHKVYDQRDGGTIFSAVNYMVWGPEVQMSDNLGRTWTDPTEQPRFTGDTGLAVERVWHIEAGGPAEPGTIYAGIEPAALFKSADGGITWREVSGLSGHPTRSQWQPGLGGLCLHSIVLDPTQQERMWVGISAVGVFGTVDAGATWDPMNHGVRADFLPDRYPQFGQCPHKLLAHDAKPDTLFQQNHCGVFRSDTGGQEWVDISEGLPSRFGFVLGLHPKDPNTLWVIPEDRALGDTIGGGMRFVTDAKFRVYRSRSAGADWEPLTNGLPQTNAYLHVMREGMATDSLDSCGIYVGTTTGQVFYSRDNGDSWGLLVEHLPPINSVECGVVV